MVREITKSMENMTDPEMLEKYGKMIDNVNGKIGDGA
jgi:hypothetical protein